MKRHRVGKGKRHTGPRQWIVLARPDTDIVVTQEGRRDLGERSKFREVPIARASVWYGPKSTESADPASVVKAREYASREGYEVFTYPSSERDPLGRAKRELLARMGA